METQGGMEAESFFGGEQKQVIENKIHLKLSRLSVNRRINFKNLRTNYDCAIM